MKLILSFILCSLPAIIIGWLVWFPIRIWLFNLLPISQWSGFVKVVIVLILAVGGGITIPFFLFVIGLTIWAELN
jgi:hypothetical protein